MDRAKARSDRRKRVRTRVRRKVHGTTARPRLTVFKSLNHIYAQVIDDQSGNTLASASSKDKDFGADRGSNVAAAKRVGELIGQRAKSEGVETVVFDRGGYLYHGRVKALADSAREQGLKF